MKRLAPKYVRSRRELLSKRVESIYAELRELKQRCSHVGSLHYSPDPSGNNDSSYDCSACGASFRRCPADVPRESSR